MNGSMGLWRKWAKYEVPSASVEQTGPGLGQDQVKPVSCKTSPRPLETTTDTCTLTVSRI